MNHSSQIAYLEQQVQEKQLRIEELEKMLSGQGGESLADTFAAMNKEKEAYKAKCDELAALQKELDTFKQQTAEAWQAFQVFFFFAAARFFKREKGKRRRGKRGKVYKRLSSPTCS